VFATVPKLIAETVPVSDAKHAIDSGRFAKSGCSTIHGLREHGRSFSMFNVLCGPGDTPADLYFSILDPAETATGSVHIGPNSCSSAAGEYSEQMIMSCIICPKVAARLPHPLPGR